MVRFECIFKGNHDLSPRLTEVTEEINRVECPESQQGFDRIDDCFKNTLKVKVIDPEQ